MPEESKGFGCIGLSALLLILAAVYVSMGVTEVMRGTPLVSEPQRQEARGGETLTGGGRAEAGDKIRRSDPWVVGEHVELLLVGGGAALLGLFGLRRGVGQYRQWKRRQRE
jgi:hypothetical protein